MINAISLETVSEVMGLVEEGILPDAEILQVSAARSKVLGRYHMMMGQNPVYIISAGGRKPGRYKMREKETNRQENHEKNERECLQ